MEGLLFSINHYLSISTTLMLSSIRLCLVLVLSYVSYKHSQLTKRQPLYGLHACGTLRNVSGLSYTPTSSYSLTPEKGSSNSMYVITSFVTSGKKKACFVCAISSVARGPPRRVSAYEISKSTGFQVDFGFQNGFLDFWISKWISGFQSGFLDFKVDFWISKWISGFQSGFLDFKADFWILKWISREISGFQANFSRDFWISSEFLDFKADFWTFKVDFSRDFWISSEFLDFI